MSSLPKVAWDGTSAAKGLTGDQFCGRSASHSSKFLGFFRQMSISYISFM